MNTFYLNKASHRNSVNSAAHNLLRYIARYWGLCLFFLLANAAVLNGQIEVSEDISGKAIITDPVSVKLINGFHAQTGSAFRAYIGPSQGQVSSHTLPAAPTGTVPPTLSSNNNYIKTIIYREPWISEPTTAFKHNEEVNYFDGLGRPIQTVSVGASPNKKDIIQAVLYDDFGREIYKPLPYAATNKTGEFRANVTQSTISAIYSNPSTVPVGIETSSSGERAYTQIGYDNSPLNRITSQTGAGTEWESKPVSINYLTNASDETVGWKVNTNGTYTALTITAPTNGIITASPVGPNYVSGTTVTLTATPNTGYQISSWGGALSGNISPTTLVMNGNKTVSATFTPTTSGSGPWQVNGNNIAYTTGKVSIGTTIANSASALTVNGKILSTEVEVVSSITSDFVFEPEYELMPLTELEIFLKKNKHLPGIPSALEFKNKGQNLGDMQDLLLRKVEELTLYILKQDKMIKELKSEIEGMKNRD